MYAVAAPGILEPCAIPLPPIMRTELIRPNFISTDKRAIVPLQTPTNQRGKR